MNCSHFVWTPMLLAVIAMGVFYAFPVRAFTEVQNEIVEDTTWVSEQSPYVVSQTTVKKGVQLTIEPGTVVKFLGVAAYLDIEGELIAEGTKEGPIYFTSINDDSVGGDTNGDGDSTQPAPADWRRFTIAKGAKANMSHVFVLYGGNNTPCNSCGRTMSNIHNFGELSISYSEVAFSTMYGIYNGAGTTTAEFIHMHDQLYGLYLAGGTASVTGGYFHDHGLVGIHNATKGVLHAGNSYWGHGSGPSHPQINPKGRGEDFSGNVSVKPWRIRLPEAFGGPAECVENCNSSVLFLPGIKGSILKEGSFARDEVVWPPTAFSSDVEELALTEEGESKNDIYVEGIIQSVGVLKTEIYGPFTAFMDSLVNSGQIEEWMPFAYDWRLSHEDLLANGVITKDGVVDFIETVENLAQNSRTGKVTVVAHSMGGILGKSLIRELELQDKSYLIDSFVLVGTPQLGTPKAITALLHGDGEGAPLSDHWFWKILNHSAIEPSVAREVAQNMPGSYTLLPSFRYFDLVRDPVVVFDETVTSTEEWRDEWGTEINNFDEYESFLSGTGVERNNPAKEALHEPEVLNSNMFGEIAVYHQIIDEYVVPSTIRVVQLVGWGLPTIKSVLYTEEHGLPTYNPLFTKEGDETVVYASADASAGETYYFDLDDFNLQEEVSNFTHFNLLNAEEIQVSLRSVIESEDIEETKFLTTSKPEVGESENHLLVSAHSPVVVGVYDSRGRFTGLDPEEEVIKEEIPGSSYQIYGGSQYIFVPDDGTYEFVYQGVAEGPTTISIESFVSDEVDVIARFENIHTTEDTEASFEVNSATPEKTVIVVDTNGDGAIDEVVTPPKPEPVVRTLEELIVLLKGKIETSSMSENLKKSLLKKVLNLEKKITKQKSAVTKIFTDLEKFIVAKVKKGKISEADLAIIEQQIQDIVDSQKELTLDQSRVTKLAQSVSALPIKEVRKQVLLKKVNSLDRTGKVTKTTEKFSQTLLRKLQKGKLTSLDTAEVLELLQQLEKVL